MIQLNYLQDFLHYSIFSRKYYILITDTSNSESTDLYLQAFSRGGEYLGTPPRDYFAYWSNKTPREYFKSEINHFCVVMKRTRRCYDFTSIEVVRNTAEIDFVEKDFVAGDLSNFIRISPTTVTAGEEVLLLKRMKISTNLTDLDLHFEAALMLKDDVPPS